MTTPPPGSAPEHRERFRRADAVFGAALDLPPADRVAFAEQSCRDDPDLLSDVLGLLRACDSAGSFLGGTAAEVAGSILVSDEGLEPAGATPPERVGPYRLVRRLGGGGMGFVWLARDDRLDRDVALKFLSDTPAGGTVGEEAKARFLVEARAAARLDHAHVAAVHDVGETTDGRLFIAMAYCPGGSLAERLASGPLPPNDAVRIARQVAAALAASHAAGILHRDVKPGNILFDGDGQVRLADFGIAKLATEDTTRSGAVRGTVAYLAPEQVRGERVDARSDLWALGVTLYEMLEGRRPFAGPSYAAVLHAIVTAEPDPIGSTASLPLELHRLVASLLAKAPASRPGSAAEVERLLADMHLPGGPPHPAARSRRPTRARLLGTAGVLGLALLALYAAAIDGARDGAPETSAAASSGVRGDVSVAVLPFANTSGDRLDEPFSEGLADELIGALGQVGGLRVASRTSSFALKGRGLGVRAVADSLGVANIVEGSVRRMGDRLKVSVHLVSVADERVLWSETYDRPGGDVFGVQEEIAGAVVAALEVQLGGRRGLPFVRAGTTDLAAYELFLKGRYFRMRRTEESLDQAARYYEQAIARDPFFARAHAGLAATYTFLALWGHRPPHDVMPRAKAVALRALALDTTSAEAHEVLAHVLWVYEWDWHGSDRAFRRARALEPGTASAHLLHGISLMDQRRFEEADSALQAARLADVLEPSVGLTLGRLELARGRGDRGVDLIQGALELHPGFSFAHQQLGHAWLALGRPADALAAFRRAAALSGERDSAHLAYALAVTGDRTAAQQVLRDLLDSRTQRYVPPFGIAVAFTGLGDRDQAFAWLERALEERSPFLPGLQTLPALAPLHPDPRWRRLLERLGLAA